MTIELEQVTEQVALKSIVYWPDGYFIADDDALEQGEILDSVEAFGPSPHRVLSVPTGADREAMQVLVHAEVALMTA